MGEQLQDAVLLEYGSQGFVLPHEADSNEAIPFSEIDRGRWLPGFNPHNAGINLWRRPKIVSPHLRHSFCQIASAVDCTVMLAEM